MDFLEVPLSEYMIRTYVKLMEMDVSDFNFCTDVSNYLPRNIKAEEEMMKIVSVKQGVSVIDRV